MKKTIRQFGTFNWRLFAALCASALLPAIYQTAKTFIVSSVASDGAFDVMGQMEWFDLINETLQAFLIIPLYSILNKVFKNDEDKFGGIVFKIGFIVFIFYALFSLGVLIYGNELIKAMNPETINIDLTAGYLRMETVAFMIGIVVRYVSVVFVVVGKDGNMYAFLIGNIVLSLISDFLLVPSFGVYGIALSNVSVNAVLSAVGCVLLYRQKYIRPCGFCKADIPMWKEWGKVGFFAGAQQFIDNFIYAVMICRMVNLVAEQGNYWIVNNFIWGWLLIPVTALSEVIRRDCREGYLRLKQSNYYLIAVIVVIVWAVSLPLWTPFFRFAENLSNAEELFGIAVKLVPFYVAYTASAIIDSIFIGLGKTVYNMVNSLLVNFVYYGIFFLLYLTDAIVFTMDTIILMFGFGMVVHWVISLVQEKLFLRRKESAKGSAVDLFETGSGENND